ncbi:MAG: type II toxin-antitoxin system HipA family toxin, partial [Gemmatimonadaceae bacterium]
MSRLEVHYRWGGKPGESRIVGTLALIDRRIYLEFDSTFLAAPLPLSPIRLTARHGVIAHTDGEYGPVFGVFDDSLPDGWGRLLMDRAFTRMGRTPADLSVLDRLAYIGDRGMGALVYSPEVASSSEHDLRIDLAELAQQSERIVNGSPEELIPALRIAGGSSGGARPKVLVGLHADGSMIAGTADLPPGYRHHLIKFAAASDGVDIGAVEAAYAQMAGAAGITMPPTRLFETRDGRRYFGVERFDRNGNTRIHVHTLSGLLHANFRMPVVQYDGLLAATRLVTRDDREVREAFRRMAFNVVAHNRDDHSKNFSYLMDERGEWRLSPAYDVVFSSGPNGEHTMDVAGEAQNPTAVDMLRLATQCDVDVRDAVAIIEQVRDAVSRWPEFASALDVPAERIRVIKNALDPLIATAAVPTIGAGKATG